MANTQAVCTSFKKEVLQGFHVLDSVTVVSRTSLTAPTKDTLKGALYAVAGALGAATTAYSATNELGNSGSYVAGGLAVTNADGQVINSSTSGVWTPSATWTTGSGFTSSAAFDCLLIYNDTQGDKAIEVLTFGARTVTAGGVLLARLL